MDIQTSYFRAESVKSIVAHLTIDETLMYSG
jgi:hypothetical protein